MASTMKAIRYYGKKDLRYEDIPVPEVKKGEVKVRVDEVKCIVQV